MGFMAMGEAELVEDVAARPARQPLARSILSAAADLILPPVCISCRVRVSAHGLLCGACFASIDFIAPPICARLGMPLPYEAGEASLSAAAIARPPVYDRARAAARYSETMRTLMGTGTRG
jgi:predicted amidophosphoribosyltransferase